MNIKKIARPMNKAKNEFLQWLKDNNAEDIDNFQGGSDSDPCWDYYRMVSAIIGDNVYIVYFMIWKGTIKIEFKDDENNHTFSNVEDFLKLIRC